MNKNLIFKATLVLLLIIYTFKINEIAINYRRHIDEVREKEKRREIKYERLKRRLIKEYDKKIKELRLNKCVIEKTPTITGILETTQILRLTNYSMIRYGDGEIEIMRMKDDFKQNFNETLKKRLLEAFNTNDPNVIVGVPSIFDGHPKIKKGIAHFWCDSYEGTEWFKENINYSKQYYDAFITSPYISTFGTYCQLTDLVYNNIKEVFRDKDLIIVRGNNSEEYDYDVYEYAKSQRIFFAPPKNAWEKYDEIKEILMKEDANALYILTIGVTSVVLVMDLVNEGRRALDLGHLAKDYDCYMKGIYDVGFYS